MRRMWRQHDQCHPQREHELLDRQHDQEPLAIHLVGQQAAEHGQDQRRPELGENDDADERARVRQVVRIGAQHDVLHPRPDVRGKGPEEHDPERPVAQRRPRRPRACRKRRVTIDDRVLDLLYGDRPVQLAGPGPGRVALNRFDRHRSIVRDPPPSPSPRFRAHPARPRPLGPSYGPSAEQTLPQGEAAKSEAGASGTFSTDAAPWFRCTW